MTDGSAGDGSGGRMGTNAGPARAAEDQPTNTPPVAANAEPPTCAACGQPIRQDDIVCPHCGTPLVAG